MSWRVRSGFLVLFLVACASPSAQAPLAAPGTPPPPPTASAPTAPTAAQILADSQLPVTVEAPLGGDPMRITVHRLSNGLTVYLSPMPAVASVRAWTVVRAGSRNDPADATGLAHYLEHMLFKGTTRLGTTNFDAERPHLERIAALYGELRTAPEEKRDGILAGIDAENVAASKYLNPGELTAAYAQLGVARFDAHTWFDVTAYTHEVPANLIGVWATGEAERYGNAVFRQFYSELEAVYEERNMRDTPERRIWDGMLAGLFPHHPYGTQTTIGTVEHLKTPRFAEMAEFYHTWYVPNDMAIVLVGDVDPATTIPTLERAFGGWKPRALPATLPGRIEPLTGRVEKEVLDHGRQSLTLAWLLPHGRHDLATWDVITELLGNTRTGLLYRELVLTQKLPSVNVNFIELEDANFFMIQAPLADGQTHAEAERLIRDVVARIPAGQLSEQQIAQVALNKRVELTRSFEDADTRVNWLTDVYTGGREWPAEQARFARYGAITKADVTREASVHLGPAFVAVYRKDGTYSPPRISKPKVTAVTATREGFGSFAQGLLDTKVAPIEPRWLESGHDYERRTGPGARVIANQNKDSDLFQLTWMFDGGARTDPLLCHALGALSLAGSHEIGPGELQSRFYALAASVAGYCDPNQAEIVISGIDANFEATLALVRDWLTDPRFGRSELALRSANALRARREALDQKDTRQAAGREYLLWGNDSAYRTVLSNKQITALTPEALAGPLRALPGRVHDTLYFGPRSLAQVEGAVALGRATGAARPSPPRRLSPAGAPEILFVPFPSAEARVYLSMPADAASTSQRAMARLFTGFSHRYAWQEVREARGLAYSVALWFALSSRKGDDGGLQASIACQADKLPETLTLLSTMLGDFKPSPARYATAKAALDADYRTERISPRDISNQVYGWQQLGFDQDPRSAEWATVQAVTLDKLEAFSAAVTKRPYRLIVIGDPKRIDLAALGRIAPVRELKVESLFSW